MRNAEFRLFLFDAGNAEFVADGIGGSGGDFSMARHGGAAIRFRPPVYGVALALAIELAAVSDGIANEITAFHNVIGSRLRMCA